MIYINASKGWQGRTRILFLLAYSSRIDDDGEYQMSWLWTGVPFSFN